jgi:membrane fusion protein (multidrug efflux system)
MSAEPPIRAPRARRLALLICAVAVGAIGLVFSGVTNRARSREEVAAWTNAQAIPTVRVVQPERGPAESELTLPGNVAAYNSSALFARASGYVASWTSDIGAHVRQGDVLATISAPDLDQQLAEAKAQLVQFQAAVAQAQATADLGRVTDQRTARLVQQGWSSAEQGDTDHLTAASRDAALAVAKANVTAQLAAVARLQELIKFEQVTAPFDGVLTQRNVNIGDLVNAGGNSGTPMLQVSDIHRMRIYVNVPQAFLGELRPGIKATLHLPGQQETFEATRGAVPHSGRSEQLAHPGDRSGVRRARHARRGARRQRQDSAEAGDDRPQSRQSSRDRLGCVAHRPADRQSDGID